MMREIFYQDTSIRKVIIQKVTCSFINLRITNLDFALETPQQVKKVHHYLPYQKE